MHTKYLLINYCCNWKTVEAISKCFPQFNSITTFACGVRTVTVPSVHSSKKPYMRLMDAHSWLPRKRKKFSGNLIL